MTNNFIKIDDTRIINTNHIVQIFTDNKSVYKLHTVEGQSITLTKQQYNELLDLINPVVISSELSDTNNSTLEPQPVSSVSSCYRTRCGLKAIILGTLENKNKELVYFGNIYSDSYSHSLGHDINATWKPNGYEVSGRSDYDLVGLWTDTHD